MGLLAGALAVSEGTFRLAVVDRFGAAVDFEIAATAKGCEVVHTAQSHADIAESGACPLQVTAPGFLPRTEVLTPGQTSCFITLRSKRSAVIAFEVDERLGSRFVSLEEVGRWQGGRLAHRRVIDLFDLRRRFTWVLEDLPAGILAIEWSGEGLAAGRTVLPTFPEKSSLGPFVLAPAITFSGTVQSADGRPIASARITVRASGDAASVQVAGGSNSRGEFSIGGLRDDLEILWSAGASGYLTRSGRVRTGEHPLIVLRRRKPFRIHVTTEGAPMEGAGVRVLFYDETGNFRHGETGTTDADGLVTLPPPRDDGRAVVGVEPPDGMARVQVVPGERWEETVHVAVRPCESPLVVTATRDDTAQPLSGAVVALRDAGEATLWTGITDETGAAAVCLEGVARVTVSGTAAGLAPAMERTVEPRGKVGLRFRTGAVVYGEACDATATDLLAVAVPESPDQPSGSVPVEGGRFVLRGLGRGRYRIVLRRLIAIDGSGLRQLPMAVEIVADLDGSGDRRVRIPCPDP